MKKTVFGAVAIATLMIIGAPAANAGSSCRIIPGFCPPESGGNPGGSGSGGDAHAVPEPATLALLIGGIGAVGAAAMRRRKRN